MDPVGIGCFVVRPHPTRPLLLLRRATRQHRGSWCPIAGRVDPGEQPAAAALRELFEETGLRPRSIAPLYPAPWRVPDGAEHVRLHVFIARVDATAAVILNPEHDASRWVSFEEASSLLPLDSQRAALLDLEAQERSAATADRRPSGAR